MLHLRGWKSEARQHALTLLIEFIGDEAVCVALRNGRGLREHGLGPITGRRGGHPAVGGRAAWRELRPSTCTSAASHRRKWDLCSATGPRHPRAWSHKGC